MRAKPNRRFFVLKLPGLLLGVVLAGCAGNEKYQELQKHKRQYPDLRFPDRAPYQDSYHG